MSLLTDDECRDVYNAAMALPDRSIVAATRHIEAAVIAKIAAGVSFEPAVVNTSGSTLAVTRWIVETPSGWVGAWDKTAITDLVNTAIAVGNAAVHDACVDVWREDFYGKHTALLFQALDALRLPCNRWNKQQTLIVNAAIAAIEGALK